MLPATVEQVKYCHCLTAELDNAMQRTVPHGFVQMFTFTLYKKYEIVFCGHACLCVGPTCF